jgi:hypothetical protein
VLSHDIVVASIESITDHVGVGLKTRRSDIAWQVHRHHIVAFALQQRSKPTVSDDDQPVGATDGAKS